MVIDLKSPRVGLVINGGFVTLLTNTIWQTHKQKWMVGIRVSFLLGVFLFLEGTVNFREDSWIALSLEEFALMD